MATTPLGSRMRVFRDIHIDVVSIDIDIYDVEYTGEGFIYLWNAEKRRKRLTPCWLC